MAAGGGRKPTQAPLPRPGGAGGRPSHPRPHLFAAGIAKFASGLGWAAAAERSAAARYGARDIGGLREYGCADAGAGRSHGRPRDLGVCREGQRHKVKRWLWPGGPQGPFSRHLGRSRYGVPETGVRGQPDMRAAPSTAHHLSTPAHCWGGCSLRPPQPSSMTPGPRIPPREPGC